LFVTAPAAADLPALKALESAGYEVAALVVDLQSGRTVAEIAPGRLLIPASVVKLYTAALALETFGPDYRFETQALARGARQGSRLDGDLVLRGGGDPKLTSEGLWRLTLDVARAGLTEVSGDLVVDESLFGRIACDNEDRCKAEQRTWRAFDSLLSAAAVNHGTVTIVVSPGAEPGRPAQVTLDPYPVPGLSINGLVQTVPGYGNHVEISRYTSDGAEVLQVGGTIGVKAGAHRIYRSLGRPAQYAGELFAALLRAAGVNVRGKVRVSHQPVNGQSLALLSGEPLGSTLGEMLYYSNNLMADMLALGLLRERRREAPISMNAAGEELQAYARDLTHRSPYARGSSGARLFDGSGLNPENRLSPIDLIALLAEVYRRPQDFPFFLGALRVPYHSPARGLNGGAEILRRMALKTGGLTEPVSAHTLAGYLRFDDGGWGAFALMVNGKPGKPVSRARAFEAMRSDIAHLKGLVMGCQ
jgi:D-alanyl-D-alanine carboxypeptidase/D-alanyl-D-alanine-endopeptidase (penicillin-binding protein 4)